MLTKLKLHHTQRNLIIIFSLLTLCMILISYFFYENQIKSIRREKIDQLKVIIENKVERTINWKNDKIRDAQNNFQNQFMYKMLVYYFKYKKNNSFRKEIISWLENKRELYKEYQSISLQDNNNNIRIIVGKDYGSIENPKNFDIIQKSKKEKKIFLSDVHKFG